MARVLVKDLQETIRSLEEALKSVTEKHNEMAVKAARYEERNAVLEIGKDKLQKRLDDVLNDCRQKAQTCEGLQHDVDREYELTAKLRGKISRLKKRLKYRKTVIKNLVKELK